MLPYSQFSTNLVTFTEEILNRKLNFLCSVYQNYVLVAENVCKVVLSQVFFLSFLWLFNFALNTIDSVFPPYWMIICIPSDK